MKQTTERKRGGVRPGAGRKPKVDLYPAAAGALAKALAGASRGQFVMAMMALGGDIDDTRAALQCSRETFAAEFGPLIAAHKAGSQAALATAKATGQ